MKLFGAYLKWRRKDLAVFALFWVLFAVSFYLYRLPLAAVIYPTLLCAGFGGLYLGMDFRRVCKKHALFQGLKTRIALTYDSLPAADDIQSRDYREMVGLLVKEQADLEQKMQLRYQDMTDYYTVWAHQIKTPISSMRLTLQNEDSFVARRLSADLNRIEQYVEMVLTFLRLDADTTDYVFKTIDLDAVVKQAVKKMAGEFIGRKIRLVYEPLLTQVLTDEKWLSFVIEQVLSNALKYTPEGSVKIYIEKTQTLCIEDTGIGIAKEDLPRIFQKGYTGYNGRKDKKASGIGLYLCKRVCHNLGHGIAAFNAPGGGTIIRIDLNRNPLQVE